VVEKLTEDLKISDTVLYRCVRFAQQFKKVAARPLSWAHYRALITVPDEKKRLALADEAAKEKWTSRDLEIEIRNLLWDERVEASDGKVPSLLPVPVLGPFYTYQVIAPETVHSSSKQLLLDLGFSARLEMELFLLAKFPEGTIVTSAKDAKGRYTLAKTQSLQGERPCLGRGDDLLYTYKAFVQKFIDADTFHVEFRLGFGQLREETIRLRGIDCPELNTPEGKAAKRFVERKLAPCEFITVKSTQTRKEKWGRYLGDIFYVNKEGQQIYLNNLLLEKGYAVKVRN